MEDPAKNLSWRMSYCRQDCKTTAFATGINKSMGTTTLDKDAETNDQR